MRTRGAVVLLREYQVLLIKRVNNGEEYFVVPGGGTEQNETPEQAAIREAWEELGVKVKIGDCIAIVVWNGPQFFYKGDIIGGSLGTGQGKEFSTHEKERGTYELMWVSVHELEKLDVRPYPVVNAILEQM